MIDLLGNNTINKVPKTVTRPAYDRAATKVGIVHLGPGIFHRSHQAAYIDDILSGDNRWAICGVSLHSSGPREILKKQDYLYTLAQLDREVSYRIVGSVKEIVVAARQPQITLDRLVSPATRIVSLSITEKGYCLGADNVLDLDNAGIRQDLSTCDNPLTAIGFLVESLRQRRDARIPPFTVVSCDNLASNGYRLSQAVCRFASCVSPDLAKWIEDEVHFPCTMVDSITPRTDDALRERVAEEISLTDAWPVQRESFSQWVIQESFSRGRPDWESSGVRMTKDVSIFEQAKLRLLNGSHSAIAYLGILAGFDTVYEAVETRVLSNFLVDMMKEEIVPTLRTTADFDLMEYTVSILQRFRNPLIGHRLTQIAEDGSQKLPTRLMDTIDENLRAGRPVGRLCLAIAAWMHFVRRASLEGSLIVDPLAQQLSDTGIRCANNGPAAVEQFLSLNSVFPDNLRANGKFHRQLKQAYLSLGDGRRSDILKILHRQERFA